MTPEEIALQLTLSAIENKAFTVKSHADNDENATVFNAKQIADFYNSVYTSITEPEFTVQVF